MRAPKAVVVILVVAACDSRPAEVLSEFVSLGQRERSSDTVPEKSRAIHGLRETRLDASRPDRPRLDADLDTQLDEPASEALVRAEDAARALAADGRSAAVRVVLLWPSLEREMGAVGFVAFARDGRGWSGSDVSYWRREILLRGGVPPTPEEVQVASAFQRAAARTRKKEAEVAAAMGVDRRRVEQAVLRIRGYLGPLPP